MEIAQPHERQDELIQRYLLFRALNPHVRTDQDFADYLELHKNEIDFDEMSLIVTGGILFREVNSGERTPTPNHKDYIEP